MTKREYICIRNNENEIKQFKKSPKHSLIHHQLIMIFHKYINYTSKDELKPNIIINHNSCTYNIDNILPFNSISYIESIEKRYIENYSHPGYTISCCEGS